MEKSKLISGIAVLVVVAVGGYFALHGKKSTENVEVAENTTTQNTPTDGKKIPFSEFVKKDGSYKCSVNQTVGNVSTVGTTYINNGMIRGEYNTKVQGMDVSSTLIVRDGFTYGWTSMLPNMGFKSKVMASTGDTNAPASGTYSFNAEQIGDYNCEPWTLDTSKFIVPTNITFKDMSAK